MPLAFQLLFLMFACLVPLYFYAFLRLYGIIKVEKPEWLQSRGSLSFFYAGLPRFTDPNVQVDVLRVAYGHRAAELRSAMAISYAKRIRILLPVGVVLFVIIFVWAIAGGGAP